MLPRMNELSSIMVNKIIELGEDIHKGNISRLQLSLILRIHPYIGIYPYPYMEIY
jgi:hypothetical protein